MKALLVLAVMCAFLVSGCVSDRVAITTPTPSLYLDKATARRTTRELTAWVMFPPGEYRAVFRDDQGIYYKAVSPILYNGRSQDFLVFVSTDGRHGISKLDSIPDWLESPLPFLGHL